MALSDQVTTNHVILKTRSNLPKTCVRAQVIWKGLNILREGKGLYRNSSRTRDIGLEKEEIGLKVVK
jgi:hypothetical protein